MLRARTVTVLAAAVALVSCQQKLEGPAPTLAAVLPTTVCTEQLTTTLTLSGDGLSPLVSDGLTGTSVLNLPQVSLVPEKTLDGADPTTAPVSIPDDPAAPAESRVKWTSQQEMTAQLFPALAVTPGLYGVHVDNRNGKSVDLASGVLAVPPPSLTRVDADLLCKDQDNVVTLTGDFFLQLGGLQPSLAVGPKTFAPATMTECRDLPGPQGVKACKKMTLALPSKSLETGTFAVTVTNPETAGCGSTSTSVTLTFTPCPTLEDIVTDLTCTAEVAHTVTATGKGFLSVDGRTPTLVIGAERLATTAKNCTDVTGVGLREVVKTCTTLEATVAQAALAPAGASQTFPVSVVNPTPADCTTKEPITFTTVPPPTVASIVPDLTCTAQGTRPVVVTGTGLLTVDGRTPTLVIGTERLTTTAKNCTAVVAAGLVEAVENCTTLEANVPQAALPPAGASQTFAVTVVNPTPADCTSTAAVTFTTVPPPAVTTLVPDLVCTAAGSVNVVVNGTGFLTFQPDATSPTALPTVKVGTLTLTPSATGGCSAVTGPLETVQSCTSLTIAVPQGVASASYPVTVTNPAPADCSSTSAVTVAVAPPPVITSLSPDITTVVTQPVTVMATGTGFIQVGTTLPTVQLGALTLPATALHNCTAIGGTISGALTCTTAEFVVPLGTTPDEYDVAIINPAPASCASTTAKLFLAPAPSLARLVPPGVCSTGSGSSTIGVQGSDFFRIGGSVVPSVAVGSRTYVPTVTGASCTSIAGYAQSLERCTAMTISVGATDFANGTYAASVVNPAPVTATSSGAVSFAVTVPPTLTGATPTKLCAGGGNLTLTGTNFTAGMQVTLKSTPPKVADSLVLTGTTSANVTFNGPLTVGGPYDVEVVTAAGACNAALTTSVQVTSGPVVFFVDPSVVFNGISTQATVYASGFAASGLTVDIRVNGSSTTQTVVSAYNPAKANRILITLPKALAAGTYDVIVSDSVTTTCPGVLRNAFRVVSTATLQLTSITAPFGYTGSSTAVTINANAGVGGGLKPLPRLYLNPVGATGVAIPLGAVSLLSASTATAVVPTGQAAGVYDLIAVNPDGTVGVLLNAFTVLTNPTPFIDAVSPALILSGQAAAPISVTGGAFRAGAVVSLQCRDLGGAALPAPAVATGTVTATTVAATVNTNTISNGSTCVVRVRNADTSTADYSTIVVTNPSSKPSGFTSGPAMTRGRRGLVGLDGSATRAAQFLYAIGGDNGAVTPVATDTVDFAALDAFGKPGAFVAQRYKLTVPRSLATGQRLGRFLYVAGGRSGATVHNTIERAYLLDPTTTMEVTDVDLTVTPGTQKLGPGVYSYRLAPVMAAGDALNPGGENLPSDPFPISLPALPGSQLTLTLHWNAVPGASLYRIYRTVAANDAAGTETLLAEIAASNTTYTDDGTVTPAGLRPLPLGSTGAWATLAGTLPQGREGAGSATAWDPSVATKPNERYLYVVGGRDGAGLVLPSAVKVPITLVAGGAQTVGTIAATGTGLTARWQSGVLTANAPTASVVGTAQVVFACGGLADATNTTSSVQASVVGANGDLGAWSTENSLSPQRAGFAGALINNFALAFGGKAAAADSSGAQSQLATPVPTLGNWSSTSGQMSVARYLAAGTLHGAFVYVLGGTSGTGAEATTEQMTW